MITIRRSRAVLFAAFMLIAVFGLGAQQQQFKDAAAGRWPAVYKALDAKTVAPTAVDATGNGFLHIAVGYGDDLILQELLKRKVPLDLKNAKGETALMLAVKNGNYEKAIVLVRKGASVEGKIDGMNLVEYSRQDQIVAARLFYERALAAGKPLAMNPKLAELRLSILTSNVADVRGRLENGEVPETEDLVACLVTEDAKLIALMAEAGFIDARNAQTLLAIALNHKAPGAISPLLEYGADLTKEALGPDSSGGEIERRLAQFILPGRTGKTTSYETVKALVASGYESASGDIYVALRENADDESVIALLAACRDPVAQIPWDLVAQEGVTLYSTAMNLNRSPRLLAMLKESATSPLEKANSAIEEGNSGLFVTLVSRLGPDDRRSIEDRLASLIWKNESDASRTIAFRKMAISLFDLGMDPDRGLDNYDYDAPLKYSGIRIVPLWVYFSKDAELLDRAKKGNADFGKIFQELLRSINKDNRAENSLVLAKIIPHIVNPNASISKYPDLMHAPINDFVKYPELLAAWLARKPDLSLRSFDRVGSGKSVDGGEVLWSGYFTPLGMAVYLDNLDAIRLLVDAGVDVNGSFFIEDTEYTPYALAVERKAKCTFFLKSKGGIEKKTEAKQTYAYWDY